MTQVSYIAPKRLRSGDRIAIVAPASPFLSDELRQGIDILEQHGLRTVLGPNVKNLRSHTVHSAPVIDRVDELMWAFSDSSIKGIMAATGGYGSAQLLPYLDYEVIRQSRKLLLGMSDITALNNGILARAGLITVNGQYPAIELNMGSARMGADAESLSTTIRLLMSSATWGADPLVLNRYIPRTVSGGRAKGHAIGVNLETFVHLYGTPYFPPCADAIMFVETVHQDGERLGRQLMQLQLGGVLEQLAGIVVGEFADVPKDEEPGHPGMDEVVIEYLSEGVPCSAGFSFSHGNTTIPIPVGAQVEMDADAGELSFDFRMAD